MNHKQPLPLLTALCLLLLSPTALARTAVVAELFTSESCSSCPPAERLLAALLERQDIDAVQLIAVAEHVDYWNYLNWKDRFSSPYFSDRQRLYALRRGDGRVYTPQLVINGNQIVVGSRENKVRAALKRAAQTKLVETSATAKLSPAGLRVDVQWPANPNATKRPLTATFFVIEDGLSSQVRSGENRGRHLSHTAVARAWHELALSQWPSAKTSATLKIPEDVKTENASVLVLLQESSGQVLGFARGKLP